MSPEVIIIIAVCSMLIITLFLLQSILGRHLIRAGINMISVPNLT